MLSGARPEARGGLPHPFHFTVTVRRSDSVECGQYCASKRGYSPNMEVKLSRSLHLQTKRKM